MRNSLKMLTVITVLFLQSVSSVNAIVWTTLDYPGAQTSITGIDGSNIVGWSSGHDFLYNVESQTWTTLAMPVADGSLFRIDGSNVVGTDYKESFIPSALNKFAFDIFCSTD